MTERNFEQTLPRLTMDVQTLGFLLLKHGAQNCPLYGDFTTTLRLYRQYLPNQTRYRQTEKNLLNYEGFPTFFPKSDEMRQPIIFGNI